MGFIGEADWWQKYEGSLVEGQEVRSHLEIREAPILAPKKD
jgi:hypothetical protein